MTTDPRRRLPSVERLLRSEPARAAARELGRPVVKRALVVTLAGARDAAAAGRPPPPEDALLGRALDLARAVSAGLRPVVNATGVILHTNLGRAPLPAHAAAAAGRAGEGYTDLEFDLRTGRRGKRTTRAEFLLAALTGAEDALVVNNAAAALLLTFAALARRRDVLVSRGELIEIGGEFRLPGIVAASGARLVEVGTTNRTRLADYRGAVGPRTGAIVKVHPSNFRVTGFTASVEASELASLARSAGLPFVYDVGSGLLARAGKATADEPTLPEALADGADLAIASGDKLLGGPQAGCIVGRAGLLATLRRHPIARAVRVDKLQVAALEAVLGMHARGDAIELPVHRMLRESAASVARRARALAAAMEPDTDDSWSAQVCRCRSVAGGGSTPGEEIPSWGVRVRAPGTKPAALAARLREGSPAVLGRVEDGGLVFDLRTVAPEEGEALAAALRAALDAG